MQVTIGVLVVNGACSTGEHEDLISNAAQRALTKAGYDSIVTRTVGDEIEEIKAELRAMAKECDIVFTAGGTGFSPCDITPEATAAVIDRQATGIADLIRAEAHKHSETSHLNRGIAGICGGSIIINLPGSADMVRTGIDTVGLLLRPMLAALKGDPAVHHVG